MAKEMKAKEHSNEFLERKKLIELDLEVSQKKHELKMEELKYQRESDKLHHERELEKNRIKSAEIRKAQMRKEFSAFNR